MTLKRKKLRDAIAFALVMSATSAFVTGTAFAQATPAAPATTTTTTTDEEKETASLETIVVTGSRIQSQAVTASSPVMEIQAEAFQYAGATRADDLINQYPQLSTYFDSFANNGATGYPTVDLRGLGPQRTLTLVNGNRLPPGAAEVTDISIIPASLIKRVDILTGGASAVYGSDAMAGVVNFILDTEFEGVSLNAGYSAYQHNNDNEYMQGLQAARGFASPSGNTGFDGVSNNIDVAIGSSFDDGRGHAMAWLTWRENEALYQGQRDYSACTLQTLTPSGAPRPKPRCGGSGTNAAGNFLIYQYDAEGVYVTGAQAHLDTDGSWLGGFGAPYNYAPPNFYQRPDTRYTFGASLSYEVNEHFKPYLETMFINRQSAVQVAESGTFFGQTLKMDCADPLLGSLCADLGFDPAAGGFDVYVGKRNVEGGPRHFADETTSYRVVTGARGAINDNWSYDANFLYGHTSNTIVGTNDLLNSRITDALLGCQPGSFNGCIFYNVWQPNSVTAEAAAALAGTSLLQTVTSTTSVTGFVTGDLGWGFGSAKGDNISLVVGGNWAENTYSFIADSYSEAAEFAGSGGPSLPVSGTIRVSELFLESVVPILKDVGIFKSLSADLGYRYSDYNTSGAVESFKIGFAADMGMFRVRGGFNRAIRAPGVNELFSSDQIALFNGIDPCAGEAPTLTAAQCAASGVTAAQYGSISGSPAGQYNQFVGGNPDLAPEQGDTWTLGFVAAPIDGMQVSLDYWDIELSDTITTIGAQTILDFCGTTGDALLCGLIKRNPSTGNLWVGTVGGVNNPLGNFGGIHTRGLDMNFNYRMDVLGGRLAFSLQSTYLLEKEFSPLSSSGANASIVAATTYDCTGVINIQCQSPEWRSLASVNFARDWYTVNLRWRYMGKLDYINSDGTPGSSDTMICSPDVRATCLGDGGISAQNYLDLSATALIGELGELTLGVNNIADKEPPLVGGDTGLALNGNAAGGYDQVGRYIFASFSVKF